MSQVFADERRDGTSVIEYQAREHFVSVIHSSEAAVLLWRGFEKLFYKQIAVAIQHSWKCKGTLLPFKQATAN